MQNSGNILLSLNSLQKGFLFHVKHRFLLCVARVRSEFCIFILLILLFTSGPYAKYVLSKEIPGSLIRPQLIMRTIQYNNHDKILIRTIQLMIYTTITNTVVVVEKEYVPVAKLLRELSRYSHVSVHVSVNHSQL